MFVEFGTLLIGALSGQADAKVKGMERTLDGGLVDTETHTVQRKSKSPINTYLWITE